MADRIIKATPETEKITKLSIISPKTTAEDITQKSERMIKLKSADKFEFSVEESVVRESEIVRAFIEEEEFDEDSFIPLPNVKSKPLSKIIEYCKKHQKFRARTAADTDDASNDAKAFDQEFVKDLTDDELLELIMAANYLSVKDLLNLLSNKVADHIANKSVEYVRRFFGIENDYTPEEEAQLREANSWAFEDIDRD